jgi:hypothetical protein
MAAAIDFKSCINVNEYCLIRLMRRHFWVRVVAIDEYGISTTFPGADIPIPGMPIELEVHEEVGYTQFLTEVVDGPIDAAGDLLLKPPLDSYFHKDRGPIRVSTKLTAAIRDSVHVRQFPAHVLNMSSGGVLLRTCAPLDLDTPIELTLDLPTETDHVFLSQIVHISQAPGEAEDDERLFGLYFGSLDPAAERALSRYIFRRIQQMRPRA